MLCCSECLVTIKRHFFTEQAQVVFGEWGIIVLVGSSKYFNPSSLGESR